MEYDLLFTVIDDENWKEIAAQGTFKPKSIEELGYIKCIEEKDLERYVNLESLKEKDLILVVIDPLRIRESIKAGKEDGFNVVKIFGQLDLDAIIDKIDLKKSKKGNYSVSVRHYD